MELEDVDTLLASSSLRPRKVRRVAGHPVCSLIITTLLTFRQNHPVKSCYLQAFLPWAGSVSGTASHFDKDCFEPENLREETITYF